MEKTEEEVIWSRSNGSLFEDFAISLEEYTKTGKASVLYQIRNLLYGHISIFRNTVLDGGDGLFRINYRFLQQEEMQGHPRRLKPICASYSSWALLRRRRVSCLEPLPRWRQKNAPQR